MERKWRPQDFIGYSEKNGMDGNVMAEAMQRAVDNLKDQASIRQEQERLLGRETMTSEEEREKIKKQMMERLGS